MNQALQYFSLVLDIMRVTNLLTLIIMRDPQTSDMRQTR